MVLRFRRAHEAHRDARLVFRAAAEGRPLELQRRMVLGKLACGLDRISCITADQVKAVVASGYAFESSLLEAELFPGPLECTPLGASVLGGHDDCTKQMIQSWRQGLLGRRDDTDAHVSISSWAAPCIWHSSHYEDSPGHGVASLVDVLGWRHQSRTAGTTEEMFRPVTLETCSHVIRQLQEAHDDVRTTRRKVLGVQAQDGVGNV